jgi:hypothetical protein
LMEWNNRCSSLISHWNRLFRLSWSGAAARCNAPFAPNCFAPRVDSETAAYPLIMANSLGSVRMFGGVAQTQ